MSEQHYRRVEALFIFHGFEISSSIYIYRIQDYAKSTRRFFHDAAAVIEVLAIWSPATASIRLRGRSTLIFIARILPLSAVEMTAMISGRCSRLLHAASPQLSLLGEDDCL